MWESKGYDMQYGGLKMGAPATVVDGEFVGRQDNRLQRRGSGCRNGVSASLSRSKGERG
jgi:hypothetical protein